MGKIPIMEVFGPTIQGEGMVVGQKTTFIRTGGCDYQCAWCDSKFTWDGSQKATMMEPQEVFDKVLEVIGDKGCSHITISGGNPALISYPMAEFIRLAHFRGFKVGLETQGSKWQDWFYDIDDLTLSPKPPSSHMKTNFEVLDTIVARLLHRHVNFSLKIVIFDDLDLEYAKTVFRRYMLFDPNQPYLDQAFAGGMPTDIQKFLSVGNSDPLEGGDISGRLLEKLGWLFDTVINDPELNDVKPLPQLHTLVWANKRGV